MPDREAKCEGTMKEHPVPGRIKEFHFYVQQDPQKHEAGDTRVAFSNHWSDTKPNVVDVGRSLYQYYIEGEKWEDVKPYIECIFVLDGAARPASAGENYTR
jgi:hypothetical protein